MFDRNLYILEQWLIELSLKLPDLFIYLPRRGGATLGLLG